MSDRPSGTATSPLPQANVDDLIAQYDEELPQRTLTRRLDLGVAIVCFLISLYVLNQVFFPLRQGNQYYLMWFLAFVLPLVFICYRPGFGRRKEAGAHAAEATAEATTSAPGTMSYVWWEYTGARTSGAPDFTAERKRSRRRRS